MDLKTTRPSAESSAGFDGALGMRHQTGDIAFATADASDVVHRAIGISCCVIGSVGRRVAEKNLFVLFEVGDVGFVGGVATVGVGDGNFQDLAFARGVRKRRVSLLDANVDVAANKRRPELRIIAPGSRPLRRAFESRCRCRGACRRS